VAPAPLELPIGNSSSRTEALRRWLTGSVAGRALVLGALLKLTAFLLGLVIATPGRFEALDTVGDIALITAAVIVAYRLWVDVKRRLLWRVRRKLTLSYIFIGFVPALLIITFFIISGLLLFFNMASYLARSRVEELVDDTRFIAEALALELQDAADGGGGQILDRRLAAAATRFPAASFVVVPRTGRCGTGELALAPYALAVGAWPHVEPPRVVPQWIPCTGHAGLVTSARDDRTHLAARAIAWVEGLQTAVIVDIPVGDDFVRELRDETGVALETTTPVSAVDETQPNRAIFVGPANIGTEGQRRGELNWVAWLDYLQWETGETDTLLMSFRLGLPALYERISVSSVRVLGGYDFGQILLIVLAVVASLFLVILAVAFVMGLGLARSITGSVHELFVGTERVKRGDFTHKISVRSRDQLGELATSFNEMTASIDELLHQKAEKERLEQELLIARNIQMSLLPQGPFLMPGLALTAHCEPAREVGGDYYDYLPIDANRLGVLIADVSGKGTSAALYMAELKGIVLSLSQVHASPRDLLIDANRIISRHLDARSFITVTYAVVDLRSRTLRYARAGHCPLIYMPGSYTASRQAQILAPDGMVVGLQLDDGEMFTSLLQEATLPLGPGDLFVLYTDGLTETMNPEGELFGDDRLAALVGGHPDLPSDELRERILRDIRAFAGSAVQQDDMTMVLLRMDDVGVPA
jgi:serine phosphatase RsbU (regulator of sigma subunit)